MQLHATIGLEVIRDTTSALISSIGSDELFQTIVDNARKMSGAKYVTLSFFDEARMKVKVAAISGGDSDLFGKIGRILKIGDFFKKEFEVDNSASFKSFLRRKRKGAIILESFHDFTYGTYNKRACALVEKITGIREIVVVPLIIGDRLEGAIGFLYPTKEKRDFSPLLLFADFALQALEKSKIFGQLHELKGNLQAIFETAGTAMCVIEDDKTISMANKKVEALLGYSRKDVVGKTWTRFIAKEDLKRLEELHKLRRKDPESAPDSYEFRLVDRFGNIKHVLINVSIISGTKKAVASLLDITESKQVKEEHMWNALVEMWSETLTAEIIRTFNVGVLPEELGLPQILEQMANLSIVPAPSVLLDMAIQGARKTLSKKGVETSDEQIRKVFTNPLLRFLRGVFVIARQFNMEVPKEYKDLESELFKGLGFKGPRLGNAARAMIFASILP